MQAYELWPPIKPFKEDYLKVSLIHTIRYALYGNPDGIPVFFLHGGPGSGSDDDDARWFDPGKYLVITHDQRGSGKSTPLGEVRENTPKDLISDIEKLRAHLEIPLPISLFGGSWGSTLALLYAETFPQNVSRMILRGIFTCTWDAQDYFYSADGAAIYSPEAWDRLQKKIPPGSGRIQERMHRLIEEADEAGKKKWCRILAEYEYSFFDVNAEEFEKAISRFEVYYPEMRINTYYQAHRFFLEDEQILKNADKIKNIPIVLINGTRDVICPPVFAWQLHRRLNHSELILVPGAGHLSAEPGIRQELLKVVENWGRG